MKFYLSIGALILSTQMQVEAGEAEFKDLITRLENNVITFAREVELLYQNRCRDISLETCSRGNYDECSSLFPDQVCPGGEDLNNAQCGDGISCSALWDFSISNVAVHKDIDLSDTENVIVIETICFTRQLDQFFRQQRDEQEEFWKRIGSSTPQMYFGSKNGAFRIYPARQYEACGEFDPRLRPWYIAASGGPKNLVLVLDTSGSMEGPRLDLMKKAAKQVVNTMTVADRIAVVEFNTVATIHGRDNKYLFTATRDNIALLNEIIDGFIADGDTNFIDAFTKTFQVLEETISAEFLDVGSATAILFLTDGRMTVPIPDEDPISRVNVLNLVTTGISSLRKVLDQAVFLFTYSISAYENVHEFPKILACDTGDRGVWSKITDNEKIFESLTSYYQLFALGLGGEQNENFTAWVEPYPFASGNILGTTVSAPVYDRRTKNNSLFLGVVGIDFPLTVVDRVVGNSMGSQDSIGRIVNQTTLYNPVIELTLCQLESFRRIGSGGADALCNTTCNGTNSEEGGKGLCFSVSEYPTSTNLFKDQVLKGMSYEDRVCCPVNGTTPDMNNQCMKCKGLCEWWQFMLIAIGGLCLLIGCLALLRHFVNNNNACVRVVVRD